MVTDIIELPNRATRSHASAASNSCQIALMRSSTSADLNQQWRCNLRYDCGDRSEAAEGNAFGKVSQPRRQIVHHDVTVRLSLLSG